MKKKKIWILFGILAVLLILGIPNLRIQSVSQYQKEQKELVERLEIQTEAPLEDRTGSSSGEDADELAEALSGEDTEEQAAAPSGEGTDEAAEPPGDALQEETSDKNSSGENKDKHDTKSNRKKEQKSQPIQRKKKEASKKASKKTPKPEKEKDASKSPEQENSITCSVEILCHDLVENQAGADSSIKKYIPSNGEILSRVTVKIKAGATAYDLLSTVCKASGVALDAEYTPIYGSYYVKGIGHIYEKQAGKRSGWIYKMNGASPNVGASKYKLSDGDACSWVYTCDGRS